MKRSLSSLVLYWEFQSIMACHSHRKAWQIVLLGMLGNCGMEKLGNIFKVTQLCKWYSCNIEAARRIIGNVEKCLPIDVCEAQMQAFYIF